MQVGRPSCILTGGESPKVGTYHTWFCTSFLTSFVLSLCNFYLRLLICIQLDSSLWWIMCGYYIGYTQSNGKVH